MMPALQAGRGSSILPSSIKNSHGDVAQLDTRERRSCKPDDKGSTPFIASRFDSSLTRGWSKRAARLAHIQEISGFKSQPRNQSSLSSPKSPHAKTGHKANLNLCFVPSYLPRWNDFYCGVAKLVRHRTVNATIRRFESFRHSHFF